MTLPIDAVAVGKAVAGSTVVGSVTTGTAVVDSATVGLVAVDSAQAVSEVKPVRLKRKMTFRVRFFMGKSLCGRLSIYIQWLVSD
jgi:hypothetical protein